MIGSMAVGTTRIDNFATSADCGSTLKCLSDLGVEIERTATCVTVQGVGKTGFRSPSAPLDCGNSGTTLRLLAGILAGQKFESVLTGDDSLKKRPMRRVVEPLTTMGAQIETDEGRAPIMISGRRDLSAISYRLPVSSAQIKSCVLLAGLNASGRTSVIEPAPTRDHTERMLRAFGVDVDEITRGAEKEISVDGGSEIIAADVFVPGDISSAAFFLVAAACLRESEIILPSVGLNPTRTAVIDVLRTFGVEITISEVRTLSVEPVGDIRVRGGLGKSSAANDNLKGNIIAHLIDEIPILAVFGTQLEAGLEVRDASELRVKESDRISAVVENLKRMKADVDEFSDGFRVGRSQLKGAIVDSFGDHRIAMAFAVAGLFAEGETHITGSECVDVSFPGFFEMLACVTQYKS